MRGPAPLGEPVTVIRDDPFGVLGSVPLVVIVSVLEHVGVHGLFENVAVALFGNPLTESVIPCTVPETNVSVIVVFPEEP